MQGSPVRDKAFLASGFQPVAAEPFADDLLAVGFFVEQDCGALNQAVGERGFGGVEIGLGLHGEESRLEGVEHDGVVEPLLEGGLELLKADPSIGIEAEGVGPTNGIVGPLLGQALA